MSQHLLENMTLPTDKRQGGGLRPGTASGLYWSEFAQFKSKKELPFHFHFLLLSAQATRNARNHFRMDRLTIFNFFFQMNCNSRTPQFPEQKNSFEDSRKGRFYLSGNTVWKMSLLHAAPCIFHALRGSYLGKAVLSISKQNIANLHKLYVPRECWRALEHTEWSSCTRKCFVNDTVSPTPSLSFKLRSTASCILCVAVKGCVHRATREREQNWRSAPGPVSETFQVSIYVQNTQNLIRTMKGPW